MGYKIRWTETAVVDVENYAEFISRDSRPYAAYFTRKLRDLAATLQDMPERGRVVPILNRIDVRELFWGSYRLIYQLNADTVAIIAVEHGARLLDVAELKGKLK